MKGKARTLWAVSSVRGTFWAASTIGCIVWATSGVGATFYAASRVGGNFLPVLYRELEVHFGGIQSCLYFMAEAVKPKYGGIFPMVMQYGGNVLAVARFSFVVGHDFDRSGKQKYGRKPVYYQDRPLGWEFHVGKNNDDHLEICFNVIKKLLFLGKHIGWKVFDDEQNQQQ